MPDATDITGSDFPAFDAKEDFLTAMGQNLRNPTALQELMFRLSNTDTSAWADPTARHDDGGII